MPTGLQVKNDNGDICIDEEYRNLVVKTSGSATIGTTNINTGGAYAIYTVDIVVSNCVSPLIATRAITDYVSIIGTQVSGSTYTFTVASNTSNFSFDYWVFDVINTTPADTFGLVVYNSSGDIVFHSSSKALRIAGVYDASGTGATANATLASGKTYAVIQGANGFRSRNRLVISTWRYTSYCAGAKWSGTDLYVPYPSIGTTMPTNAPLKIDHSTSASPDAEYIPAQVPKFLAIDVTNY